MEFPILNRNYTTAQKWMQIIRPLHYNSVHPLTRESVFNTLLLWLSEHTKYATVWRQKTSLH